MEQMRREHARLLERVDRIETDRDYKDGQRFDGENNRTSKRGSQSA